MADYPQVMTHQQVIANNTDRQLICEVKKLLLYYDEDKNFNVQREQVGQKKAEADGEKNVTSLHICRMKNGTFARLARAFSLFVHFEAVLFPSTT